MATVAQIQAALDSDGNGRVIKLLRQSRTPSDNTEYDWYVTGGVTYRGKAGWVQSTVADSAADQATDITTATAALYP